jgi:hypothetical protein
MAPHAGANVILVAQNATYTVKHEAPVSAGQQREQAGMNPDDLGRWFNMGEQSDEVA